MKPSIYIVFGLLPMCLLFAIALAMNFEYKTIFAALYLGFGAIAYAGLMKQEHLTNYLKHSYKIYK